MKMKRRAMVGAVIKTLACVLLGVGLLPAQDTVQKPTTSTTPVIIPVVVAQPATAPASADTAEPLLAVKRIYVDSFGDDAISKELSAAIVSALTDCKRFIVTENKEKADATLKGNGLEKTSQEFHAYDSATSGGSSGGGYSSDASGSWTRAGGSVSGHSSGGYSSVAAAIQDSNASTQTINDARVAVRLVNRDGDVIWANTQESKGGKYKGAVADAADQVVKQLIRDCEKAERRKAAGSESAATVTAKP